MRRSGAETWSARMKRILGFLSLRPTGGEAVEGGPEGGGVWGVYINGGV